VTARGRRFWVGVFVVAAVGGGAALAGRMVRARTLETERYDEERAQQRRAAGATRQLDELAGPAAGGASVSDPRAKNGPTRGGALREGAQGQAASPGAASQPASAAEANPAEANPAEANPTTAASAKAPLTKRGGPKGATAKDAKAKGAAAKGAAPAGPATAAPTPSGPPRPVCVKGVDTFVVALDRAAGGLPANREQRLAAILALSNAATRGEREAELARAAPTLPKRMGLTAEGTPVDPDKRACDGAGYAEVLPPPSR
jgi:hypothetical protein